MFTQTRLFCHLARITLIIFTQTRLFVSHDIDHIDNVHSNPPFLSPGTDHIDHFHPTRLFCHLAQITLIIFTQIRLFVSHDIDHIDNVHSNPPFLSPGTDHIDHVNQPRLFCHLAWITLIIFTQPTFLSPVFCHLAWITLIIFTQIPTTTFLSPGMDHIVISPKPRFFCHLASQITLMTMFTQTRLFCHLARITLIIFTQIQCHLT